MASKANDNTEPERTCGLINSSFQNSQQGSSETRSFPSTSSLILVEGKLLVSLRVGLVEGKLLVSLRVGLVEGKLLVSLRVGLVEGKLQWSRFVLE